MHVQFTEFNDLKKFYKYDLPESELIDLVDTICIGEAAWKEYVFYSYFYEISNNFI